MSNYEIVCTDQTDCSQDGHITGVGTSESGGVADEAWTVRQVWDAMDRGHNFYTWGGGKVALVRKFYCGCGRGSLRSEADSTTANNLDSLRLCRWKAA